MKHRKTSCNATLYASGEFLSIHTREAGPKRLRFARVVPQVTEVFTGAVVARNATEVTVNLPVKTTVVYDLGTAPNALAAIIKATQPQ